MRAASTLGVLLWDLYSVSNIFLNNERELTNSGRGGGRGGGSRGGGGNNNNNRRGASRARAQPAK
jgi:hypothetical protein